MDAVFRSPAATLPCLAHNGFFARANLRLHKKCKLSAEKKTLDPQKLRQSVLYYSKYVGSRSLRSIEVKRGRKPASKPASRWLTLRRASARCGERWSTADADDDVIKASWATPALRAGQGGGVAMKETTPKWKRRGTLILHKKSYEL